MKNDIYNLLRNIKHRLPADRQERFAKAIRARIGGFNEVAQLDAQTVAKYTIGGAVLGAALDIVPGLETLAGVDGFVDIGAAIGAFLGAAKSQEEYRARQRVREMIIEELRRINV